MIRALQKKFVITSMTAISVLLLVLLGGINITNIVLSDPPIILSCAQILPGRSSPPMSPASRP